MIDWARVRELRSEVGEEGFAEIVELFLDEVEELVMRLRTDPSPDRFESDLHFLKGSAWNLGFAQFGALCQDGERKAAAGTPDLIDPIRIVDCYFASKDEFLKSSAHQIGGSASAA